MTRLRDRLFEREFGDPLQQGISELPADYWGVLALFVIVELSYQEIAEILGILEGTAWSRLHRARKLLTERIRLRRFGAITPS